MLIVSNEELNDFFDRAEKAPVISFDTETTSLYYFDLQMIGYSIAFRDKGDMIKAYIPLLHNEGNNANLILSQDRLKSLMQDSSDRIVVMHNAKYDMMVLHKYNIEIKTKIFDTLIMAKLIDENRKAGLKSLSYEEFRYQQTEFNEILKKGEDIRDVDTEKMDLYASDDAEYTLKLYEKYAPIIKSQKLDQVLEKIEMPLVPVLCNIAETGIRVDNDLRLQMDAVCDLEIDRNKAKSFELLGKEINLNSPKQLGQVLFRELHLPVIKETATGNPSVNVEVLDELSRQGYPVAISLKEYRWYVKMKGTFLKGLTPVHEDLIYPSFFQMGTVTGRLSSGNPNMQNLSLEKKIGVRALIIPYSDEDTMLVADYSQIELRFIAHFSEDKKMIDAFMSGADFHEHTAQLLGIPRKSAKTVNFGVIYGLSAFSLARDLGISKKEAEGIINNWFEVYKGIRDYKDYIENYVMKYGYVKTVSGRRRRVPDVWSDDWKKRGYALRQAFNTTVQGSAADLMKYALIKVYDRYKQKSPCRIMINVHDEIIASVKKSESEEVSNEVKQIMENCIKLKVPIKTDPVIASNWWWCKMYEDIETGKISMADVPALLKPRAEGYFSKFSQLEV